MTLTQAFTIWGDIPKNTALAVKYRDAIRRVLMKRYADTELCLISEQFARNIFTQSTECSEMKARAASILVQLLQWGADNGHCHAPSFTVGIASQEEKPKPRVPAAGEPLVKVKPEALARRKAELAARNNTGEETTKEPERTTTRGRAPRPFAQIDPKTLEVVKVWPTMKDAEREMGAYNIDRCARLIRKSAGFYWSDAAEADTFKERLEAKVRGINPEQLKKPRSVKIKKTVPELSGEVPDEVSSPKPEQPDNGIRAAAHDALKVFTDEELCKELELRGWEGEIRRHQVVRIGKMEKPSSRLLQMKQM